MDRVVVTVCLLAISNTFMTFAWYAHLRDLNTRPWIIAALASWGVAFFEYMLQVPANRIGHQVLNLGQLKILQEVLALTVFVPFAVLYMRERIGWNYALAAVCIFAAVFFIFCDPFQRAKTAVSRQAPSELMKSCQNDSLAVDPIDDLDET